MTIDSLSEHFDLNNGKSYLFILNTITSARKFYNLIRNRGIPVTYLSTHVIPKERLNRIREIKEKKYMIVVSTQLVEAGVDIDFDVVVRDIAPLDSINQAAGRCNRNDKNKGKVYIVLLKDDNDKKIASYVYDVVLLDISERILSKRDEIEEVEFLELIDHYYKETKEKESQNISKSLLESIIELSYDSEDNDKTSISDFKLMDDDYPKIDVFIELDEEAKEIWKNYINLKHIDDLFSRKKAFDAIKPDFYQYIISIPMNTKNKPPMVGEIGYVKQAVLNDYYNPETGFITKDLRSVVIW